MKLGLSDLESEVLHALLESAAGDTVIRLNAQGFIDQRSDNLSVLGIDLSAMLLAPHIADLAERQYVDQVSRHFQKALESDEQTGWIEFCASACGPNCSGVDHDCRQWFALSLRRVTNAAGEPSGALGLLRSVERVRNLEDELFAQALTDPLTGLVNRQVFLARLRSELHEESGGYLAFLAIDCMRALFMQYGQRTADEINWGFAKFLQAMVLPGNELSQVDGERFAVILPGLSADQARRWIDDVLTTFTSLALPSSGKSPKLTASAGLAKIENSVDWTMRQAELALIMARAGGGMQMAQGGHALTPSYRQITANCDAMADALGEPLHRR